MGKKVLLVDDDADDRELFCEALASVAPDFNCCTAPNGRRAILALDNKELELPDLIFLDINMPIMNGWQCLSILKSREDYKAIPVVIYSTSSHAEEARRAQQEGAFCFFNKPSNFKDLKNSLETLVYHLNNETLPSLEEAPPFYAVSPVHTK